MGSIVGFTAFHNPDIESVKRALAAQQRMLSNFTHLEHRTLALGETRTELWGHKDLSDCLHSLPDGSLLVLVGSPHGEVSWSELEESLARTTGPDDFELPWDGRVILLRISADGKRWTMWNDWIGSIPVFHCQIDRGHICSTLEPAVVAAAGFSSDDVFLPGLLCLLINGHFLADWTLFKRMKVVPPDCAAEWDSRGFHYKHLWTVRPSQDRWEAAWDDLVDEMYELSRQAIASVLKTQSSWILPLSGGLDSRLIAAVGAELGSNLHTYAWGSPDSTDVVYSRHVARALGLPWKRVELGNHYLAQYTQQWADLFGSGMHFHGMYQMRFLDVLTSEKPGPVLSGFMGDPLAGSHVRPLMSPRANTKTYQLMPDDYSHWNCEEVNSLLRFPLQNELGKMIDEVERQTNAVSGARFQCIMVSDFWGRQRLFVQFHPILCDYLRGVATPFLNKAYARFCVSLPRVALQDRQLQSDMFRRHYGRLATIPGTYASEPFIRTGGYLLKQRIARVLPALLRRGPFKGFDDIPLRMDMDCLQAYGSKSLWPINEVRDKLAQWLDVSQLDAAYQAAMASKADIRPLRKLQSVQALAYRLLDTPKG
jgi:hypothetical protein